MLNDSANEPLRVSPYPRSLVIQKTRLGIPSVWWGLIFALSILLFVMGVLWYFIAGVIGAIYVLAAMATRWEPEHFKIYRQYSRQANVYEPGFFIKQTVFRRPEGVGREYLG